MKIATFNVENLFQRAKAMNQEDWSEGQPALDAVARLNRLFQRERYTEPAKREMLELLDAFGQLGPGRPNHPLLRLQKIRGQLFSRKGGTPQIVAEGRGSWVGWMELKPATIEDEAIKNTARVLADVDADIVTLVEVESRQTLRRFHDEVLFPLLKAKGRPGYDYDMVIEGNDARGIDIGLLSRFPIDRMRSHLTDRSGDSPTFSRDCPEYYVTLPSGAELVVLPNHLASKGSDPTGDRRRVQSAAIAKIYKRIRQTHDLVLVAGDLNDHPEGGSLDRLLNTDLKDAMSLPFYDGLPGTYGHGRDTEKLDYLLCSPKLRRAITEVGVNRKGYYAPKKWESYESINSVTKGRYQASDHHCVWAEVGS